MAEGCKEREAGRRKALARKVPVTAIMSQRQRSRIEEVLAQLRGTQLASTGGNASGKLLRICFPHLVHCIGLCILLTHDISNLIAT